MLRSILAALLAFLLFLIIHFLDFHYTVPVDGTHNILWAATFSLIALALILHYLPAEEWFLEKLHIRENVIKSLMYPLLSLILFGTLLLVYLEFYHTAQRSISLKILMLIEKQPQHEITRHELFKQYAMPNIIDRKFSDLEYDKYIKRKNNKYVLTEKGKFIVNIYKFTIEFLHLENDGPKDKEVVNKNDNGTKIQ